MSDAGHAYNRPPPFVGERRQQPQYRRPEHHDHNIYLQPTPPSSGVSVTRVTMPIVLAIVTAAFLMSATYFATSELGDIKFSIEKLTNRVDQLSDEIKQRDRNEWSRADHERWCMQAERINQNIGWRCSPDMARTGWTATERKR